MRVQLLMVVAVGFVGVAQVLAVADRPPKKENATQQDAKKLEGTWVIASVELNGQKITDLKGMDFKVVITATKIVSRNGGQTAEEATYKLDLAKNPKQIVSTGIQGANKGKVTRVIYVLEGDTLKLGQTADGKDPPKGFTGAGAAPIVVMLKRQKG
jgi:uncharacterized protein (TIGR03067 family)